MPQEFLPSAQHLSPLLPFQTKAHIQRSKKVRTERAHCREVDEPDSTNSPLTFTVDAGSCSNDNSTKGSAQDHPASTYVPCRKKNTIQSECISTTTPFRNELSASAATDASSIHSRSRILSQHSVATGSSLLQLHVCGGRCSPDRGALDTETICE
jgi:hypothetical protein